MKGPPTASLIAAPAEQFSLCRTKEAERERRAEQFPDMLGTVDCLQLVPCSQVIVGNILTECCALCKHRAVQFDSQY